jgi:hypothetical protein
MTENTQLPDSETADSAHNPTDLPLSASIFDYWQKTIPWALGFALAISIYFGRYLYNIYLIVRENFSAGTLMVFTIACLGLIAYPCFSFARSVLYWQQSLEENDEALFAQASANFHRFLQGMIFLFFLSILILSLVASSYYYSGAFSDSDTNF